MTSRMIPWAAALVCLAAPSVAQDRKEVRRITEFDAKTGEITLPGKGRALSDVLRELAERHGIVVTVRDFHERTVVADIDRRPLAAALQQLLGADARYKLEVRGREIDLRLPQTGQRTAARQSQPTVLPTMDQPTTPRADAAAMPDPSALAGPATPLAGNTMAPAQQVPATMSAADAARRVLMPPRQDGNRTHAQLVLRIAKDGTAIVDRVVEREGPAAQSRYLHGPCLYAVHIAGELVTVGAMQDPIYAYPICTDRPADPRLRPVRTTADEALVTLTLDDRFLEQDVLSRASIRFYRLNDGADLPKELTPKTFAAFRGKCDVLCTVDAHALTATPIRRK